jgi:hypothetical protein
MASIYVMGRETLRKVLEKKKTKKKNIGFEA